MINKQLLKLTSKIMTFFYLVKIGNLPNKPELPSRQFATLLIDFTECASQITLVDQEKEL